MEALIPQKVGRWQHLARAQPPSSGTPHVWRRTATAAVARLDICCMRRTTQAPLVRLEKEDRRRGTLSAPLIDDRPGIRVPIRSYGSPDASDERLVTVANSH
jgi:hypothetical protein